MAVTLSSNKQQLLEGLRQRIQGVSAAGRADDGTTFSSGSQAFDQLLPQGGYSRGTIAQWFNPPSHNRSHPIGGHGAELLSLMAAKNACRDKQAIVVIDPDHTFNPPAAAALGIELSRLIILRSPTPCQNHKNNDLMWSIDQSLRCHAVGVVWGMIGDTDPRWLRRFQLSAEQSGVTGCFVRPGHCASHPSWSEIDWQIKPQDSSKTQNRVSSSSNSSSAFPISLRLLRAPGGHAGRTITVQVNTITGSVQEARVDHHATSSLHLATQLANPAPCRRAATA